jgi:hypothetical protein
LRGLGNAHFAAPQATFGDGLINPENAADPLRQFFGTQASHVAQGDTAGACRLKQFQKTRSIYFAAPHCHAMNVTL